MNERIRELAEQATRIEESDELFPREVFDREKFAELIIQDCISQIAMIGVSNCDDDDVVWTVDKSIENIRKHFGIEK